MSKATAIHCNQNDVTDDYPADQTEIDDTDFQADRILRANQKI